MNYKAGLDKPRNLPGKVLRDLLNQMGISGNDAADLAGWYLGYSRQAVQAMMSRTIRTNDLELLEIRLAQYKMEVMLADSALGPVREDGKRHKNENWRAALQRDAEHKREDIRKRRAIDPSYGRYEGHKPRPKTRSTLKPKGEA